jgi:hypothetical protein
MWTIGAQNEIDTIIKMYWFNLLTKILGICFRSMVVHCVGYATDKTPRFLTTYLNP